MTKSSFSIGELARSTGTKVETIRYYERIRLLPPPARTGGNYRAYADGHLARLSFEPPPK
jgi:DNA-binding transcriptional MerR regulator